MLMKARSPIQQGPKSRLRRSTLFRATMIFDTKSKAVEDPDPEVRQLFKDIPL